MPFFEFVLENELFLPVRLQSVVNCLRPIQAEPTPTSAVVFDVEDTEGIGLGEDVHVLKLIAAQGELHVGGGSQGLARHKS